MKLIRDPAGYRIRLPRRRDRGLEASQIIAILGETGGPAQAILWKLIMTVGGETARRILREAAADYAHLYGEGPGRNTPAGFYLRVAKKKTAELTEVQRRQIFTKPR